MDPSRRGGASSRDTNDQLEVPVKILAVGATGAYASMVVPELVARGLTVRALVRSPDRSGLAMSRGATEVAIGDLSDPASLRKAADGVDGVFHLNPAFAPDEAATPTGPAGSRRGSAGGSGLAVALVGPDGEGCEHRDQPGADRQDDCEVAGRCSAVHESVHRADQDRDRVDVDDRL